MRPKDILASVRRFQIETGIRDPYVDSHIFPEKVIPRKSTRTVFRMGKTTAEEKGKDYSRINFNFLSGDDWRSRYEIGRSGTGQITLTHPVKKIVDPQIIDPDFSKDKQGKIRKIEFFNTVDEVQKALEKIHGPDPLSRKIS